MTVLQAFVFACVPGMIVGFVFGFVFTMLGYRGDAKTRRKP